MRVGRAAVLGLTQGAAEVIPVSSSAQLVLLPWLLRWEQPTDRTTFAAGLHAGSCLGIAWALREELRGLDRRTLALLAASSLPAAVAGAAVADRVEERLGRPPQLAALLAAAGAVMWWVDARQATQEADPRPVDARQAALAGLAQVVALIPGVSRSGATLTALRAAGVERAEAERFSLLMSLPVTAGAAVLTLARADCRSLREMAPGLVSGTTTAALAGALAATRLRRHPGRPLAAAAFYRLGLAAVVARRLVREGVP
ncbi:MAG: undecaprenyl-diphosphate phosphatase [Mycobacteriales bacterium]